MTATEGGRWTRLIEAAAEGDELALQAYGMVWYLASTLGLRSTILAEDWVADAARNASYGLDASPMTTDERST